MESKWSSGLRWAGFALGVAAVLGSGLSGCTSILNPAFVDTLAFVDDNSIVASSTLRNAPGHVALLFVNNTTFDPALIAYLERVQPSAIPEGDIRPRVRFQVQVDFVDGSFLTFEFVDGSEIFQARPEIGDPGFEEPDILVIPSDLTDNELTNAVVLCDVAQVTILDPIEVYVPVYLKTIMVEEAGQGTEPTRQLSAVTPPRFQALLVDDVDENLSTVTIRNFGIRDVPAPAINVQCGTVVAGVLTGTLQVPFVVDESGEQSPGFLDTDLTSQAALPGRYRMSVTLQ